MNNTELIPLDVHAHGCGKCGHAVVSGSPAEILDMIGRGCPGLFSVGLHPWDTQRLRAADIDGELARLAEVAALPRVVAVGECGLDTLRGAPPEVQEAIFRGQVEISESVGKPLVLHVVKTGHRIMRLCKLFSRDFPDGLRQPWIWHGFRGSPSQALQFLALRPENYISFGDRFNASTPGVVPLPRLLVETDESQEGIAGIIARVAHAASIDASALSAAVASNLNRIFA